MLDEEEYGEALRMYRECMRGAKELRQKWNVPLAGASIDERFRPVREWYERMTGAPACHEDAVMHHRLARFGNPCRACGKPLRSPRAKRCFECGTAVADEEIPAER